MNEIEQIQFCEILDNWYSKCKGQFKGTHPLGMRKEDLKSEVCKWIESKNFSNENKAIPFPKLAMGKKLRTQRVYHRIVMKHYENGLYIKPLGNQGLGEMKMKKQDGLYITEENVGYLFEWLKVWESLKKMADTLENDGIGKQDE